MAIEKLDPYEAYDPLNEDNHKDVPDVIYKYSLREFEALEEYAKDLDLVRACAAAGYKNPNQKAQSMMKDERFKPEINAIHEIYRTNVQMTAERSSHRFIKFMDKLEGDYDKLDTKDKKGLAAPMTKMLDSYLKATGHFDGRGDADDKQVVINIDLGDGGEMEVDRSGRKAKVKKNAKS